MEAFLKHTQHIQTADRFVVQLKISTTNNSVSLKSTSHLAENSVLFHVASNSEVTMSLLQEANLIKMLLKRISTENFLS